MSKKQIIKINENQLKKIVTESVKKVLKEDYEGSYGIIDCLEKYNVPHNLASVIEGAITYVAGIKSYDMLSAITKYIDENMINEQNYTMANKDF